MLFLKIRVYIDTKVKVAVRTDLPFLLKGLWMLWGVTVYNIFRTVAEITLSGPNLRPFLRFRFIGRLVADCRYAVSLYVVATVPPLSEAD